MKTRNLTKRICILAIFTALSYVAVTLNMPIPSPVGKPMFHCGNLVVLLCALLFNGPIGGTAGAIGMGLYDITHGYGIWTIKTIILKFAMGLSCGLCFALLQKRNKPIKAIYFIILGTIFTIVGIALAVLYFMYNGVIVIPNLTKVTITWPIFVFSIAVGISLLVIAFVISRVKNQLQWAVMATIVAVGVNLAGEFIAKIIKLLILGNSFGNSLILSFLGLPATLINGVICIIAVMALYPLLSKVFTKRLN